MYKESITKISIHTYGKSLRKAIKLIDKFKKINNMNFNLEIKLDFDEEDLGRFDYSGKSIIFINPVNCALNNKKYNKREGSPWSNSIMSTVMHEFSHLLDDRLSMLPQYTLKKQELRGLVLSKYSNEPCEELAEIGTLFLINPYLIKLLDNERYKWLKSYYKSPTPCGKKTFFNYYNSWSSKIKKRFRDKFNIKITKKEEIIKC